MNIKLVDINGDVISEIESSFEMDVLLEFPEYTGNGHIVTHLLVEDKKIWLKAPVVLACMYKFPKTGKTVPLLPQLTIDEHLMAQFNGEIEYR